MWEFVISVLAVVVWAVLWAVSAAGFTLLSLLAAALLERFMLLQDRWTYPFWIVALALCPAAAFVGSWTLFGLLLPADRFYGAVRAGGLAAGVLYAVVGMIVVAKGKASKDKLSETITLIGSMVGDAAGCVALVWFFGSVEAFMRSLGGG